MEAKRRRLLKPPQELNQLPERTQSLQAWSIVREGNCHFVQRVDDRNERYVSPDGSNFVEGIPHPPFIRQATWSLLRQNVDRVNKDGDTWVCTFPKCGTTLMEQIVLLLRNAGDSQKLNPRVKNDYDVSTGIGKVWPEVAVSIAGKGVDIDGKSRDKGSKEKGKGKEGNTMTLEDFNALPAPRLLKTHAPRALFLGVQANEPRSLSASGRCDPLRAGAKVIYVARNAKDACVSAYYHAANPHKTGWPFDAWAKHWLSGLLEFGRWSDHVMSWRAESLMNSEQVLWVRYEDLVLEPDIQIRRVASFLALEGITDEVLQRVVKESGFAHMKAQSGDAHHMRKGEVGDYATHFSSELEEEFNKDLMEQLRGAPADLRGML